MSQKIRLPILITGASLVVLIRTDRLLLLRSLFARSRPSGFCVEVERDIAGRGGNCGGGSASDDVALVCGCGCLLL